MYWPKVHSTSKRWNLCTSHWWNLWPYGQFIALQAIMHSKRQLRDKDTDRENMGFYMTLHVCRSTTRGQRQGTIVFYCVHPVPYPRPCPCPVAGPVQSVWAPVKFQIEIVAWFNLWFYQYKFRMSTLVSGCQRLKRLFDKKLKCNKLYSLLACPCSLIYISKVLVWGAEINQWKFHNALVFFRLIAVKSSTTHTKDK